MPPASRAHPGRPEKLVVFGVLGRIGVALVLRGLPSPPPRKKRHTKNTKQKGAI